MKKILLGLTLLTSISSFAGVNEVFKCTFSEPELAGFVQNVEINGKEISTSIFADGETFVDKAPCDLLPTGNGKMSLICTDEEGESMSIVLDTVALTLEAIAPSGFETSMSCTRL